MLLAGLVVFWVGWLVNTSGRLGNALGVFVVL